MASSLAFLLLLIIDNAPLFQIIPKRLAFWSGHFHAIPYQQRLIKLYLKTVGMIFLSGNGAS